MQPLTPEQNLSIVPPGSWTSGTVADMVSSMPRAIRKVTVNLPAKALDTAMRITGKGLTPTLIEALGELERRSKRSALRGLRGKVRFELDLAESRR